ncbi:hypothetical protein CFN78_01000 [Amycolatopsis antarctica]|uniref:UPF0336 protein CFN78_01000 n=1 Tax=Amycolatopsis antarctica TaxID=1854586 RepID=A0A263DBE9_9PSEU|nr:MaoC family dehydratase N-terminal domain-containing protein [Amycolatopsis antarctica]OZM74826.1 hypothetical protein CFN78_01000 [Amycolatopsis antarctica]
MPLDPAYVGRSYPPSPVFDVSRGKIAEFADAIGDGNAIYRDVDAARAAGHPDVIAPPTFLTIISLAAVNTIVEDPALGLDYSRMVHGDQRFEHTRPVHAGDRLTLTAQIEDAFTRAGNDFLTVRADIADADGAPVAVARAQLVVRGESE